jgi:hypothetical protein
MPAFLIGLYFIPESSKKKPAEFFASLFLGGIAEAAVSPYRLRLLPEKEPLRCLVSPRSTAKSEICPFPGQACCARWGKKQEAATDGASPHLRQR